MSLLVALWMVNTAQAESWCAAPLVAHEWGVEVLRTDGRPPRGVPMPSWFHHRPDPLTSTASPVRHLPPDSGVRTLPVIQFYAPRVWGDDIPVGLEVGFSAGEASDWYPQVDRRIPADAANSPTAAAERSAILAKRSLRAQHIDRQEKMPPDPTRQLGWDNLTLHRSAPNIGRMVAEVDWVDALREMPGALWVQHGDEAERFVFYEADTHEQPALVIERGESWTPERPHYLLRNRADWPVHDVLIVADGFAWTAPSIPAGTSAGFLLNQPIQPENLEEWLRGRWTDAEQPEPPETVRWDWDDCVMMRDPAIPVEVAEGHRLYTAEVDVLMDVWSARLLQSDGVHLVYREDTAALDALMPASVYTDMYHFVEWSRLGVVLVEGLHLP